MKAPIIIDSPNQQVQDAENVKAMISLILRERPADAQLILGTVSLHGEKISGDVVTLDKKLHLLDTNKFDAAAAEFADFTGQMF